MNSRFSTKIITFADAPIADYGIVAELFQAVPVMTEKFKELLK